VRVVAGVVSHSGRGLRRYRLCALIWPGHAPIRSASRPGVEWAPATPLPPGSRSGPRPGRTHRRISQDSPAPPWPAPSDSNVRQRGRGLTGATPRHPTPGERSRSRAWLDRRTAASKFRRLADTWDQATVVGALLVAAVALLVAHRSLFPVDRMGRSGVARAVEPRRRRVALHQRVFRLPDQVQGSQAWRSIFGPGSTGSLATSTLVGLDGALLLAWVHRDCRWTYEVAVSTTRRPTMPPVPRIGASESGRTRQMLRGSRRAEHAQMGGPPHGDLRLPAHGPRLLSRPLQAAAGRS
jgi:hypothetical protein